ncbi:alpha/beta fold hydrolase [Lentzea albidocapillata]|uniref:Pimeloyl-ACP methyl ester carboxylesterase n=1 Tax=Lentzea albidocapillata TaxID=40571 RepID=A0A1W2CEZ4_9PSEU|nr:alpha/beta hydrolase [Lentzea albidocapillata]SMC83208.1 Pimeloyl-ACP methyl ester carboxylesterase [Lentzea albidocapillata]
MARFTSFDGTELAYREEGEGTPLIVLAGGPGRASEYLETLGGLDASRRLIVLDNRGTGASDEPADPFTYRRDMLVRDVEMLRRHLGLDVVDVVGHSAGAGIAMGYAADFPEHVGKLVLLTPALRSVGLSPEQSDWDVFLAARVDQPRFEAATAALARNAAGDDSVENRVAASPLLYARWDERARAHANAELGQWKYEVALGYNAEGAFVPGVLRRALVDFDHPVLVYVCSEDPISPVRRCAQLAELFSDVTLYVHEGVGHYPWVEDPERVSEQVAAFLDGV